MGRGRLRDAREKRLLAGQGSAHHVNRDARQLAGKIENPIRSLYPPDVARPQHVEVAQSVRTRRFDQHCGRATLKRVMVLEGARLAGALREDRPGAARGVLGWAW